MLTGHESLPLPHPVASGFAPITTRGGQAPEAVPGLGIDFGLRSRKAGETTTETHPDESVWVLLHGTADLEFAGERVQVSRQSIFDEPPTALHLGPQSSVTVQSASDGTEWAIVRAA